ncbi:hypothetical protein HJFPF1_06620 [Paramyrothecium foliicola]|nr:hypothetical protein HJFPF1_06620 [Paramyrothecium foliicola]
MATSTAQPGSKPSKKRTVPVIERTESPAPSIGSGMPDKAADSSNESPYIKELHKNIRNINKKITNASKTDSLLSQHAGKSLDELVASKIINTDQKAQILKKPALQAQVAQLEEQLVQYQKVHDQYNERAVAEKAEWEKNLSNVKAEAVAEAKEGFKKELHDHLLVLSQFLRLAAYRREEAKDPESDESQAIEGVLLAIYAGDDSAVSSMLKLVEGSDDQIWSVPGEQLQTTYSTVKTLAKEYKTPFYAEGTEETEAEAGKEVATDPTVAHASATEIAAGDADAVAEPAAEPSTNGLANTNVADDAANAVAESHWDTPNDMSISQEWVDVKVPRDPTETDTGLEATPAAAPNTQSWADDQPEHIPEQSQEAAPADPNDGFHQVQRNRGRNEREGGTWRGRGRGEWQGRGRGGHRGDGRGRGRGNRNAGGAPRGGRRTEES